MVPVLHEAPTAWAPNALNGQCCKHKVDNDVQTSSQNCPYATQRPMRRQLNVKSVVAGHTGAQALPCGNVVLVLVRMMQCNEL